MINLLNYFRSRTDSGRSDTARVAKERLQILVARDRVAGEPERDYMPALQEELLEVIRKYISVGPEALELKFDRHDDCEVLEVKLVLPEESHEASGAN